jgi:Holliday junction resolvase RusA-like endonuclease
MPAAVAVSRIAEFRIDAVPPSLNRLLRNRGLRIREPAKWHLLVRNAARGIQPFHTPVSIQLTFAGTRSDADNLGKLVMDGLVRAGLIRDDRFPFVQELTLRVRPGKKRSTTVRIEPMAEGRA